MIMSKNEEVIFDLRYHNDRFQVWRGVTSSLPLPDYKVESFIRELQLNDLFEKTPRDFKYFYAIYKYHDNITIKEICSYLTTARGNINSESWGIMDHEKELDSITLKEPFDLEKYFADVLNLKFKMKNDEGGEKGC